jgi:hypothetical protein
MDKIDTYPMQFDEAAETQARDLAPSTDERSRPWADTKPAEGPPRITLRASAKRSRRLARFAVALVSCGLAAYALLGLLGLLGR